MGAWCVKSEPFQLWSRATLSCFLLHRWPECALLCGQLKPSLAYQSCLKYIGKFEM